MSDSVRSAYKNIVGQFVAVVCCLSPFLGLLFMQSSINATDGLGLFTNAISYSSLTVSVFFSPLIVGVAGTKPSLFLSCLILTIYTCSNFYPHWFTLLPAAGLAGFALGLLWVAMYSHATSTAVKYHSVLNKTRETCTVLLASATGVAIQLAGMVGASVSSIVLFNMKTIEYNSTSNDTGSCGIYEEGHKVSDVLYYPLMGIYTLMNISALLTTAVFLDNFRTDSTFGSKIRKKLYTSAKLFISSLLNISVLLLFPMFILHGLLLGYISGDFSKVFISDCIGLKWLGFVHAVYGLTGGVVTFLTGKALQYMPQPIVVFTALLLSFSTSKCLIYLKRTPHILVIFSLAIAWAVGESMFMTLAPGIAGILFPDCKEQVFAYYRLGMAIGYVISYATALSLETYQQLWLISGVVMLTGLCYILLQIRERIRNNEDDNNSATAV